MVVCNISITNQFCLSDNANTQFSLVLMLQKFEGENICRNKLFFMRIQCSKNIYKHCGSIKVKFK